MTGASAFVEYQDGDPNTAVEQVSAIFAALHQEGIIYRAVPASYEAIGQRITLSDQVLESHQGNCIELTLLMASVLEAVGINSGGSDHAWACLPRCVAQRSVLPSEHL